MNILQDLNIIRALKWKTSLLPQERKQSAGEYQAIPTSCNPPTCQYTTNLHTNLTACNTARAKEKEKTLILYIASQNYMTLHYLWHTSCLLSQYCKDTHS